MSGHTKREEIVKASIEVFVNEGFDRPSMESIAAKANVSKRTLYKHFSNKKALLDEILLSLINETNKSLSFKFSTKQKLGVQMKEVVKEKTKFLLIPSRMKLAKIIMSEHLKDEGFLKEHLQTVLRNEKTTLSWIEDAQDAGLIDQKNDSLELLERLNELINGIIFFPILFGKKEEFSNKDIDLICQMFLGAFGSN